MKKGRKGQVSLEFLTTYGWAFLVALVAIGALAYFGVLNPSKYTPKRCNFGSEISCNDYRMHFEGTNPNVTMRLTNNIGATVNVSTFNVTNGAANKLSCTPPSTIIWNDGQTQDFSVSCTAGTGGWVKGEKTKVQIKLVYYDFVSGSSYTHSVNGEVYDEVQ